MRLSAAVITVSDKGARGERADTSGPALRELLERDGWEVVYDAVVPDEEARIRTELVRCADELRTALVLTTGGTGLSPRDVTPEATRAVVGREVPGLPELMRAESMKLTPHGCLSRGAAGVRGETLIVNLPGSEKAARECFEAIRRSLGHAVKMLRSAGSAECAEQIAHSTEPAECAEQTVRQTAPSLDQWLRQARADPAARECGLFLFHNGVVRETSRARARESTDGPAVTAMELSCDRERAAAAVERARALPGIHYVRVWLNSGRLEVGDDIMLVLVGGDIRPRVAEALRTLVEELKSECVTERELF